MSTRRDRKGGRDTALQQILADIENNVPLELTCSFCAGVAYAFPQPEPHGRIVCPRCSFNGAADSVRAELGDRETAITAARQAGDQEQAEQLHRDLIAWMGTCPGVAA